MASDNGARGDLFAGDDVLVVQHWLTDRLHGDSRMVCGSGSGSGHGRLGLVRMCRECWERRPFYIQSCSAACLRMGHDG